MIQYEQILKHVGSTGRYQVALFIVVGLINCFTSIENMVVNFMSPEHDHWCHIPELSHLPEDAQKYLALPFDEEQNRYDQCHMYDIDWTNYTQGTGEQEMFDLDLAAEHRPIRKCDAGYVFSRTVFTETATSQWSLVCDDKWIIDLISPIYTAGMLIGSVFGGLVSDIFGRRQSIFCFTIVHLAAGLGTAFSPNVWLYILGRFFVAVAIRGAGISGAVLLMEVLAPKHRTSAVVGYQIFLALGVILSSFLGLGIRHFRLLQLIIIAPLVLMLSYRWILPESPRWYLAKGRVQEACDVIKSIAKVNGRELPEGILDQFHAQQVKKAEVEDSNPEPAAASKVGLSDLFKHAVLRRYTLVCDFLMAACLFVDLGVTFNLSSLFGSVYLNVFLSGATEFAASLGLLFVLKYLGRRPPLVFSFLSNAVCCFVAIPFLISHDLELVASILSIVSRCLASCCYIMMSIYAGELFPTTVRQVALGSANAVAAAIGIGAPVAGGLGDVWTPIPNIIFGALGVVGTGISFLLPETFGCQLPETIEDCVNLRSNKMPKRKSKKSQKNDKAIEKSLEIDGQSPASISKMEEAIGVCDNTGSLGGISVYGLAEDFYHAGQSEWAAGSDTEADIRGFSPVEVHTNQGFRLDDEEDDDVMIQDMYTMPDLIWTRL